jgi:hypothetical protein
MRVSATGLIRDVFDDYDEELVFVYLDTNMCAQILADFEQR